MLLLSGNQTWHAGCFLHVVDVPKRPAMFGDTKGQESLAGESTVISYIYIYISMYVYDIYIHIYIYIY